MNGARLPAFIVNERFRKSFQFLIPLTKVIADGLRRRVFERASFLGFRFLVLLTRTFSGGAAGWISTSSPSSSSRMVLRDGVVFFVFEGPLMRIEMGLGFDACFQVLIFLFCWEAAFSPPPLWDTSVSSSDHNREVIRPRQRRRRRLQTRLRLPPLDFINKLLLACIRSNADPGGLVGHVIRKERRLKLSDGFFKTSVVFAHRC